MDGQDRRGGGWKAALRDKPALTTRKSLSGVRLKLWDEVREDLVAFE